jgi:hypothetical protein
VAIQVAVQSFGTPEQPERPSGLPRAFGPRNDEEGGNRYSQAGGDVAIPQPRHCEARNDAAISQPRHCEERGDAAISQPRHCEERSDVAISQPRHCEERSDVAIHAAVQPSGTAMQATEDSPRASAAAAIAAAAVRLNELRENWLNPPEWTDWAITPEEAAAGFPQRPVARPGFEAELAKRTLTNLYNQRPAWLVLAHRELDAAVAAAYGWTDYTPETPDTEILRRLLRLNLERSP